ncbi:uncharacterized protein METZ01_LOCUS255785, partial [marine metagenome]
MISAFLYYDVVVNPARYDIKILPSPMTRVLFPPQKIFVFDGPIV